MCISCEGEVAFLIGATDMGRSINWYEKVLGCELLYKQDDLEWCELRTNIPGVTLGLSKVEPNSGFGSVTFAIGVTDLDNSELALEAAGISHEKDVEVPNLGKTLMLFDPDENALVLYEKHRAMRQPIAVH
jgi:predicted enzyme related to lactoylglutathione lyase